NILTKSHALGQHTVWNLYKELLNKVRIDWNNTTWGSIIGCRFANWKSPDGKKCPGANRHFNILVSESAYFIWKTQCKQHIKCEDDPEQFHTL
ncbi:hypothetical protein BDQ17DRAFT_1244844, partial [Cyathus striatus]